MFGRCWCWRWRNGKTQDWFATYHAFDASNQRFERSLSFLLDQRAGDERLRHRPVFHASELVCTYRGGVLGPPPPLPSESRVLCVSKEARLAGRLRCWS